MIRSHIELPCIRKILLLSPLQNKTIHMYLCSQATLQLYFLKENELFWSEVNQESLAQHLQLLPIPLPGDLLREASLQTKTLLDYSVRNMTSGVAISLWEQFVITVSLIEFQDIYTWPSLPPKVMKTNPVKLTLIYVSFFSPS